MLQSPYDEVRKKGAIGLRALGETFADPRPSRPVAFRVVIDGKPAAQQRVEWSLQTAEGQEVTSSAESDGDGFVRIARVKRGDESRMLLKVAGKLKHGGKEVLKPDSAGYRVLAEFVRRLRLPGHCGRFGPVRSRDAVDVVHRRRGGQRRQAARQGGGEQRG